MSPGCSAKRARRAVPRPILRSALEDLSWCKQGFLLQPCLEWQAIRPQWASGVEAPVLRSPIVAAEQGAEKTSRILSFRAKRRISLRFALMKRKRDSSLRSE